MYYVCTIECHPVGAGEIVQWLRPLMPSSHLHRHTCGKQICMQAKHSYIYIYVCIKRYKYEYYPVMKKNEILSLVIILSEIARRRLTDAMRSYSHIQAEEIDLIETGSRIVIIKPGTVTHACNPRTWEAKTGNPFKTT